MDMGIIEMHPAIMKLEYCMMITEYLQKKMIEGVSKLVGEDCFIASPIQGTYPEKNPGGTNTVIIQTRNPPADKSWATEVARFSLKQLPGCCGILVSYYSQVMPRYQGKGVAQFLVGIKEQIARDNDFTMMMATTTDDNKAEKHILEKCGWTSSAQFTNSRTGNPLHVYTKILLKRSDG